MIVVNGGEAIVFDTPADEKSSAELISFVTARLTCHIKAIIPTHFHEDCVAGLEIFNGHGIPSYTSNKTIKQLKNKIGKLPNPIRGFNDSLALPVGNRAVYIQYFGEGHTKDNIIGYFPDDKAVFGGCLIKELGAGKGNLADANTKAWPVTVRKLKQRYPQVEIVIPGHGKPGSSALFDYTINLFRK